MPMNLKQMLLIFLERNENQLVCGPSNDVAGLKKTVWDVMLGNYMGKTAQVPVRFLVTECLKHKRLQLFLRLCNAQVSEFRALLLLLCLI